MSMHGHSAEVIRTPKEYAGTMAATLSGGRSGLAAGHAERRKVG